MTVQELIDKLSELPENLRSLPVRVETETEGAELGEVISGFAGRKTWWEPEYITLSGRY